MYKVAQLTGVKAGPDDGLEAGQFTAYASTFDVKDSYGDVVVAGAFLDSLAAWAGKSAVIPLLFGHNTSDPDFNVGHVVSAVEDERGLKVTGQLDLDGPKGQQVYRLVKGRRIDQMSFAYNIVEGGPAKSERFGDYFELRKLDLHEVSIVPFGANPDTEILSVKHLEAAAAAGRVDVKALTSARDALDSAIAILGGSGNDQGKASATEPATPGEAPVEGVKSGVQPMRLASANALLALIQTMELE